MQLMSPKTHKSLLILIIITIMTVVKGATISLYSYDTSTGKLNIQPTTGSASSTVPSCDDYQLSRMFYGGYGNLGKYGSVYRYMHSTTKMTEFRACDCQSGTCCESDYTFCSFNVAHEVSSVSYAYDYPFPVPETIYYTKPKDANIYGFQKGATKPTTYIKGSDFDISESLGVWSPVFYGNSSFLAKFNNGTMGIVSFDRNYVSNLCPAPSDFADAKLFKTEYSAYYTIGFLYYWVKPDNSVWVANMSSPQAICSPMTPKKLIDSSNVNPPVIDMMVRSSYDFNSFTTTYTDSDGLKIATTGSQPNLVYPRKQGNLWPLYFEGRLMTLCDPDK